MIRISVKHKESAMSHFRHEDAEQYDQRISFVLPGHELLHQSSAALLATLLPDDARILVVGAGTGADVLALHRQNPSWHFTCVEPLEAMLEQARAKTAHIVNLHFHLGFLAELPPMPPFDAALCQLVSHFIPERAAKGELLAQIAARLKPQGWLIQTDVIESDEMPALTQFALAKGMPPEAAPRIAQRFAEDIHPLSAEDFERLAGENGFAVRKHYFRSLTVSGWLLQRQN